MKKSWQNWHNSDYVPSLTGHPNSTLLSFCGYKNFERKYAITFLHINVIECKPTHNCYIMPVETDTMRRLVRRQISFVIWKPFVLQCLLCQRFKIPYVTFTMFVVICRLCSMFKLLIIAPLQMHCSTAYCYCHCNFHSLSHNTWHCLFRLCGVMLVN